MDEETEQIVEQIIEETELGREKVLEKIEKKQEELSGFITPEGAATIIARNQGVTIERKEPEVQKLLIEDLSEGMSNVDIVGKVSRIFDPREFERNDGSKGQVANIVLRDKTGEIRVVLWDKMVNLISEREIQKGSTIRLKGAYIKKGRSGKPELNIGRRSEVEINPEDERVEDLPSLSDAKVKISDLNPNLEFVDIIGRVIAVTAAREFERSDKSVGKVSTLRIIDETGQCRVSLWGEKAEKAEEIEQGDAVKLENASVREGWQNTPELHIDWRGRVIKNINSRTVENLPDFEKKLLKIEEIEPDMPVLDLAAKVQRTFSVKEFERNDGSVGRVMNVNLADETGTIRASFWDEMVEIGNELTPGDVILLENARSAAGLQDRPEIRVGRRTDVEINPEDIQIEKMKPARVKMSEIEEGLDSVEILGRIVNLSEVREFTRSDESEGKVTSLTLGDETGTARVTLWGSKTDIIDELEKGDIIRITDAYSVSGNYGPEIHASGQSNIEINPLVEEDIPSLPEIEEEVSGETRTNIEDVKENTQVKIRGTIVRIFERPPIFEVCPKCGRNINNGDSEILCEKCDETVKPEHRAVINMVVDDGTDNIRVVAFGELGEQLLGKTADEIYETLREGIDFKEVYDEINLAGKEIIISGGVKRDDYYDQLELRAKEINFPDPVKETEKILDKIKSQ